MATSPIVVYRSQPGPKGDKGDKGDPGPRGIPGPPGKDGLPGSLSAEATAASAAAVQSASVALAAASIATTIASSVESVEAANAMAFPAPMVRVAIGDAVYARQSEPSHLAKWQDATGAWFGIVLRDGYAHASWFGDGFQGLKVAWSASKNVRGTPGVDYVIPNNEYLVADEESVRIDAPGSRLILPADNNRAFQIFGKWEAEQDVSSASGSTVVVDDGSAYSRGQILKIISDDPLPEYVLGAKAGEFIEVSSVSGNTITLMKPLRYAYTTGIRIARLNKDIVVDINVREIVIPLATDSDRSAIQIYGIFNPQVKINYVPVVPENGFAVRCISTFGGKVDVEAMGTSDTGSQGYGIGYTNAEGLTIRVGISCGGIRHVVDGGSETDSDGTTGRDFERYGGSAYIRVYDSMVVGGTDAPFQCHHGVYGLLVERALVAGGTGAFTTRAVRTVFRGCTAIGTTGPVFGAFEQYGSSECDTDETVYEDCRGIDLRGQIFNPTAGKITISGGEFELAAGSSSSALLEFENTHVTMTNRPRFIIKGTVSNRVISTGGAGFALLDLGDTYIKLTQANNPTNFIQIGDGAAPVVKWDGLTIEGEPDAFTNLITGGVPAAGSKFGRSEIGPGFTNFVNGQTLAAMEPYITGVNRDLAARREHHPQVNSFSFGTMTTGTLTLPTSLRRAHYTNNGAHTLAPPAADCELELLITNGATAGAITTSGWTAVRGDSFTTTNTHRFLCRVSRLNGVSVLDVRALQ